VRRPGQTKPQRVSTRCRCFLPDLTGFTGVHRAGLNPDDTWVPLVWKLVVRSVISLNSRYWYAERDWFGSSM